MAFELGRRQIDINNVDFIIVGAQSDREPKVAKEEVYDFIEEVSLPKNDANPSEQLRVFRLERGFFKCSAKTGYGVQEIIDFAAKILLEDKGEKAGVSMRHLDISEPGPTKSKCCGSSG